MSVSFETAIIEAASPKTDPKRLQALSHWEQKDERSRLRQALASNPNSEEGLLLELAGEYPDEVIENPRFQHKVSGDEIWWENVQPISMLRLLAALGPTAPKQARLDFFDELGCLLANIDPLFMSMEQQMSFTKEITVEWRADSREDDDAESGEQDSGEDVGPDPKTLKQQDFDIDLCCVVDEGLWILYPPDIIDDPISIYEQLINCNSSESLLSTLTRHGWSEQASSLGDYGYWEIKSVSPQLDCWEICADLSIDGSGTIQIEDPAGETHVVEVEAPDKEYEYLKPTLKEHPDILGSIFETEIVSSTELVSLLQQLIASMKHIHGVERDSA
jgi:hypothetical protein